MVERRYQTAEDIQMRTCILTGPTTQRIMRFSEHERIYYCGASVKMDFCNILAET